MSQRYIGGVVTETTNVAQNPWTGEWTQQAALQGFAGAQAPTRIANSLRFRSSASAYLNRTPASAGDQQKFSLNLCVKRGALGTSQTIFYAGGNSTYWFSFAFASNNTFNVTATTSSGATAIDLSTSAVFRDPSSWYLITLVVDTTNATAANRVLIYVNGISQALTITTSPTQNQALAVNGAVIHTFGRLNYATTSYFDGYMAEVNFIDGQALTPSSFGETNATTGVWIPKSYTGTYGTNGFKLNFSNGTSTTTLGYDSSGNGNNWTTNNISLTAGSTYDWMLDSPVNSPGSSYGVGNYAVLNPLITGNVISPSNGNLASSLASGANAYFNTVGTIAVASGKWYWECSITAKDSSAGQWMQFGVVSRATTYTNNALGFSGNMSNGYAYYNDGYKAGQGTTGVYGASFTTNDVIGVALDLDAGTLTFYKNGTSQGQAFSGITSVESWLPIIQIYRSTGTTNSTWINFGQRPFAYTPPSGYKSLCTQNLPVATIYNGANYMAATLYTGTGGTNLTVTGSAFQPGFVWIKKRGPGTANHCLNNEVMGVGTGVSLYTAATSAAGAYDVYGYLSALTSTGFTTQKGTDPTYPNDLVNESGSTYVAWQWKAGGTAVTNTNGSITSSVSANTTAGFSVVTYTGTGANATVGHGLGVAPSMVIVKNRSAVDSWIVGHTNLTSWSYYIQLNSTNAQTNLSTAFNGTAPASTVFSVGTLSNTNQSTSNFVAYCFAAIAGYSAFGSYAGNNSSDGPFVYCGFRPRFILRKGTVTAGVNWSIIDTSRNTYNVASANLYPNLADAEGSSGDVDVTSNGFKIRSTSFNASGEVYIYAAFAENPFQISLAR